MNIYSKQSTKGWVSITVDNGDANIFADIYLRDDAKEMIDQLNDVIYDLTSMFDIDEEKTDES